MACVALASLMATIKLEFLQPFPRVPLLLHQEPIIHSFLGMISSLQAFLKESRGAAAIKDLEIQIRDFALKAEDNIEIQLRNFVLAKDKEDEEKASQQLHQALQEAAEIASELLNIIDKVSSEADDDENEIQPSIHHCHLKHAYSEFEDDNFDGSSQCFPELTGGMFGRDRDREEIIKNLIPKSFNNYFSFSSSPYFSPSLNNKINVVFIVGMMGIGKTTLAKSVYQDPKVEDYFDVRGWITMPQQYNKSQMIRLLLRSISPAVENKLGKGSAPNNLVEQVIRTQLRAKRFLIVLDNIHDSRALHDIQICVYCGYPGSTILLTTGNFNLGFDPMFYYHKYTHYMTLLDQNQSWDLFCNNMISLKGRVALKFEKIKSHIIEICDGLPWSIVAVAKRLAKCQDILKEWEKVKKEMESLGILDRNALTFHYNRLSEHLKVCFLYFGVFPKRKEIQVKKLIWLWVAEGFLEPLEHEELENRGYVYLHEFIDRSLLLICNQGRDGNIKTCRMHSALHSFCVGEAQKAGIFCAVNTLQHTALPLSEFANSSRWLSLYAHSFDYYVLFSTNKPRSIFFFDDDPKTFVPFKLLRVLAFVPSSFLQRVSMHSRHLIFLRYLFISQRFEGLGNIVSNNPNLHTLIVSGDEPQIGAPIIHLPSTLWELQHLRHLELGDMYTIDDPPSRVTMMNLQTLSLVSPTHCGREVYFNFPNIRKVELFYKEDLVPSHIGSNPITLYNLDYLERLERLTISISISCIVTLPERCMFPLQLKKLNLSGAKLSQRDLTAIGMLSELRVLKLKNVLLGRVWKVAGGEFRKLRFLLIEDKKLKQWQIDETYTSLCLERLVLKSCYCLEQIPSSFVGRNLKHIELDGCNPSIVASAKQLYHKQLNYLFGRAKLIIDGAVFYGLPSSFRRNFPQEILQPMSYIDDPMSIINHANGIPTFGSWSN